MPADALKVSRYVEHRQASPGSIKIQHRPESGVYSEVTNTPPIARRGVGNEKKGEASDQPYEEVDYNEKVR